MKEPGLKERKAQHATIVIERRFPASPLRAFKAFADPAAKARWFFGPEGRWKELERSHDIRVGGSERVIGSFEGGPVSTYEAVIHDLVPGHRLVYSYTMKLDDAPISVSLASVVLEADGDGVRLLYTEQAVFLDGYDDAGQRQKGSEELFDRLGATLGKEDEADAREVVSSRVLAATPDEVFAAFADPARLARWWGPQGFSSTFEEFELRLGGQWRFVMHGPDGKDYPNHSVFGEIDADRLITFEHMPPHHFFMRITLEAQGERKTLLRWQMIFDSPAECERSRPVVLPSNEQNFDRLEVELAGAGAAGVAAAGA